MEAKSPYISVIIATRNEEKYISACIDSLVQAAEDFKNRFEIIVADGMSDDGTLDIIHQFEKKHSFIHSFKNEKRYAPSGWNQAIKNAKGSHLIIVGAHAHYPRNYIRESMYEMTKLDADVVGGSVNGVAVTHTLVNKTIAAVLSHPFGSGFSFRTITDGAPREADSVFGACYRKEILEKVHGFDERLIHSQDMDLFIRMKKAGARIFLIPKLVVTYYPKTTLTAFVKHNLRDGIWSIYPMKFKKWRLKVRHWAPGVFVVTVLISLIAGLIYLPLLIPGTILLSTYFLVTLVASTHLAITKKNLGMIFVAPLVFCIRHLVYGFGAIVGAIKLLF